MPGAPFYKTGFWQRLRTAALQRDRYTCTVPHCGARAVVVDHIISPRNGGQHVLANLRCLCRRHDNMVKERPGGGDRFRGGAFVTMCDRNGMPTDPDHPWAGTLKRGRG